MNFGERFPNISDFLASYFHPYWQKQFDWQGEEPSFELVARHYKTETPSNTVALATNELEELLELPFSSFELKKYTENFFDYYQGNDLPLRQVLENVLKVLKEPNNGKPLKNIEYEVEMIEVEDEGETVIVYRTKSRTI